MNKKIGIILISFFSSYALVGCTKNVENQTVTISLAEEQISGSFTGVLEDKRPMGEGRFVVSSENEEWSYEGGFDSGKVAGNGTLNNAPCEIMWQETAYQGTYSGTVMDGIPNGQGKFTGSTEEQNWYYDGDFINGMISGNGKFDNVPFEAELMDATYHGVYTGTSLNGKPDGSGIFEYHDNDGISIQYDGSWKDGKLAGAGELKCNNLSVLFYDGLYRTGTYDGTTENGIPNGEGTFESFTSDMVPYTYSGEWKNGCWNGYGEQIYAENDKGVVDRRGNFENGRFVPSLGELMVFIADFTDQNDTLHFNMSIQKKDFLDEIEANALNGDLQGLEDSIDLELTYEKFIKKNETYNTVLMETGSLYVSQILEYDYEYTKSGCFTEMVCYDISNISRIYYMFYPDSLPEVYEGTQLEIIGVPLSNGNYNNVNGGITNCVIFLPISVEVK
ncbi:MAG: hypothetical protein K2P65_04150 [Lachnospiraceae bacterium]|nr:hypothetical protein [Lachnospiraceae bacterium]